jgi:hypothetical protein
VSRGRCAPAVVRGSDFKGSRVEFGGCDHFCLDCGFVFEGSLSPLLPVVIPVQRLMRNMALQQVARTTKRKI